MAVQTTGFDPAHVPARHVSLCVQALLSLHAVPSGADGFEQTPDVGSQVPATWHASLAAQVTGLAPTQAPVTQVSLCVHALLSLHAVPSGADGFEQTPDVGSQVPETWHASLAAQATGFPPTHTPLVHTSVWVHALPSLHAVPFGTTGFTQTPVLGSHAPATWHESIATQMTGLPPAHAPPVHKSVWVQAFPSLQAVPLGAAGFEQAPDDELHVPAT
jgi:hypothetical protein